MAGSRLGASLVAALRVIGADDTDFEAWEAAGDAFPWLKANEAEGGGEEEPSWAKTGALALPANVLTQTAQKVLKGALDLEYKRRYGEEEPVVEEKQLATGQCTPAVRAALLLRLGEKKLLLAAGAALDADLGRNLEDEPPGKRAKH